MFQTTNHGFIMVYNDLVLYCNGLLWKLYIYTDLNKLSYTKLGYLGMIPLNHDSSEGEQWGRNYLPKYMY